MTYRLPSPCRAPASRPALSRRSLVRLLGGTAMAAVMVGCGGTATAETPPKGTGPSKGAAGPGKDDHAPAGKDGHGGAARPTFGPTYVVKDRLVNLVDPGGRRYLRFSVAIEFEEHHDEAAGAPPDRDDARRGLIGYAPEHDGYQPTTGGKDSEKEFQSSIKKYLPAIEDTLTTVLSSKSYAEIAPPEGREALKLEIRDRLNALLAGTDLHVSYVYFTDFVIQ